MFLLKSYKMLCQKRPAGIQKSKAYRWEVQARTSTTSPRSNNKVCGGRVVPIYPRDTCPTQTVTCLQVVAYIEPLGLVHGPPHLFFLFDPQTQWTPTISLLHFPKTRTHRTRVSPYSSDFLVPCQTPSTPPLPFLGLPFLVGATHHQCIRHI